MIDDEIRRERDYYESLLKQNGIEPYDGGTDAQARIFYSGWGSRVEAIIGELNLCK